MLESIVKNPTAFSPAEVFWSMILSLGMIGVLTRTANNTRKILFINEVSTEISVNEFPFAPTKFPRKIPRRLMSVK